MGLEELWASEGNTTQACQAVLTASWKLLICLQHGGDEGLGVSNKGPQVLSKQDEDTYTSFPAWRAHIFRTLSLLGRRDGVAIQSP